MTRALRRAAADVLREAGVASPERDAELLLAHVLDVPLGRLGDQAAHGHDSRASRRAARSASTQLAITASSSPSSTVSRL